MRSCALKEWEEKTGMKWLPKEEYKKKRLSEGKRERKQEADAEKFALSAIEAIEEAQAYPTHTSILHYDDFLADSGATIHITHDITRFEDDFTTKGSLPAVKTIGGLVKAQGRGTVILKYLLVNGQTKRLKLLNILYFPNSGANLFSGKKLLSFRTNLSINAIVSMSISASIRALPRPSLSFRNLVFSSHIERKVKISRF